MTRVTVLGLLALSMWLLLLPPTPADTAALVRVAVGLLCAGPLLWLAYRGRQPNPQWGVWVAIVLIPYFALSVGAFLVTPAHRLQGVVFSSAVAVLFFSAIAASRVRGRE